MAEIIYTKSIGSVFRYINSCSLRSVIIRIIQVQIRYSVFFQPEGLIRIENMIKGTIIQLAEQMRIQIARCISPTHDNTKLSRQYLSTYGSVLIRNINSTEHLDIHHTPQVTIVPFTNLVNYFDCIIPAFQFRRDVISVVVRFSCCKDISVQVADARSEFQCQFRHSFTGKRVIYPAGRRSLTFPLITDYF